MNRTSLGQSHVPRSAFQLLGHDEGAVQRFSDGEAMRGAHRRATGLRARTVELGMIIETRWSVMFWRASTVAGRVINGGLLENKLSEKRVNLPPNVFFSSLLS